MKIPQKFTLGAVQWKVSEEEVLPGVFGATNPGTGHVVVLKELPATVKEQTFCHELVHCILFSMGKQSHEHDETFVDGFGTFLHQYLTQISK